MTSSATIVTEAGAPHSGQVAGNAVFKPWARIVPDFLDRAAKDFGGRPAINFLGTSPHLCGACRPRGTRRGRPPGAWRQAGRPRRALPSQHALFRDRLLCGAEDRRGGRELQSALRGTRAGTPDPQFRHERHARHRPAGHLRQGRDRGGPRRPAQDRRVLARGGAAGGEIAALQGRQAQGADHPASVRRAAHHLRRAARVRRDGATRDDRVGRCRGAAIHRRHQRNAQGRDADACQRDRQFRPERRL